MAAADHDTHRMIARFENFWIAFSIVLLVVFVVLVFHAVSMHGAQVGKSEARQPVDDILARPEFAQPDVRVGDNGSVTASVVARAFSFDPGVIEVPVDTDITFRMTSADVIHGFQVKGTGINVELIPGEISELSYRFREEGEYPLICNQYCGAAHQNMINTVRVVSAEAFAGESDSGDPSAASGQAADSDSWQARGEQIYASQCVACHQADGSGRRGVFPPLAGHAPDLVNAEGGREYLINVLLYGVAGGLVVDSVDYSGQMPAFGRLTDDDIAAVVNHTLHAWGNADELAADFDPVTAGEVTEHRDRGLAPADVLDLRPSLD